MHQTDTSPAPHIAVPFCLPSPVAHGHGAAPETAPGAAQTPADGDAPRGRPTGYSEKVLEMLCDLARRFGLSDSAAAEQLGMSTSTISRWKQQFPEVAPALQQARAECRTHHLAILMKSAEAEHGRGWRVSAWLLERLFPGDYSPHMRERFAHRNFEDQRREREERAAIHESLQELRAAQETHVAPATPSAARPASENRDAASATASHNSQNADATATHPAQKPGRLRPETTATAQPRPTPAKTAPTPASIPSQNSRKAAEENDATLSPAFSTTPESGSHHPPTHRPRPRAAHRGQTIPSSKSSTPPRVAQASA